ncbi:hypothetical protein U1Q18_000015 [Sarracenia purpurea var. burkii]
MDGVGRGNWRGLWRNVIQRLGLKGMIGFCGSSWTLEAFDMNLREVNVLEGEEDQEEEPVKEEEEPYNIGRCEDGDSLEGQEFYTTLLYVVDVEPKLWLPVRLVEGRLSK